MSDVDLVDEYDRYVAYVEKKNEAQRRAMKERR